jgi:aspartate-semialdehyde dehydrogenase
MLIARFALCTMHSTLRDSSIGVVGATGAVGTVTIDLLGERGFRHVRALASARSAGTTVGGIVVEEATPDVLSAGDLDVCLFSVGTAASRELVPHAVRGGAIAIDKSSAYRLQDGVPLLVPEVNAAAAADHQGILANPNCCSIPLSIVLAPLHEAFGLTRVRVSTYQSMSGAGAQRMEELRATPAGEAHLDMDWEFDGEDFDEEQKIRAETRKILGLSELPISVTCMRVPVLVGHTEAVWIETEATVSGPEASAVLADAPGIQLEPLPRPRAAVGIDSVLVGRVRKDETVENGVVLLLACDNLRKGAALNAIQIAELVLEPRLAAA